MQENTAVLLGKWEQLSSVESRPQVGYLQSPECTTDRAWLALLVWKGPLFSSCLPLSSPEDIPCLLLASTPSFYGAVHSFLSVLPSLPLAPLLSARGSVIPLPGPVSIMRLKSEGPRDKTLEFVETRKMKDGAGMMVSQLRASAKDLNLVPGTHMKAPTLYSTSPGDSKAFFWLPWVPGMQAIHQIHAHKMLEHIKLKLFFCFVFLRRGFSV